MADWDVIIVGAGSAGAALAHRLSQTADCRVLLLEAGPEAWIARVPEPSGASLRAAAAGVLALISALRLFRDESPVSGGT